MPECISLKNMIFNSSRNSDSSYYVDYSDKDDFKFDKVYAKQNKEKYIVLLIYVEPDELLTNNIVTNEKENPTTLKKAIGPYKEYQLLFKSIEKTTSLPKKRIARLLNKSTCNGKVNNIEFNIKIPSKDILDRESYFGLK